MPYRYEIKQGAEQRVFANSRRISETVIESDEPLESVYLTPIVDQPAPATAPAVSADPSPITPPVTTPQATPAAPALSPTPDNTQNKEASSN